MERITQIIDRMSIKDCIESRCTFRKKDTPTVSYSQWYHKLC